MDQEQNNNTAPNTTPNTTPNNTSNQMPGTQTEHSVGPAIGIIIILLVVVLGGLYFWGQRVSQRGNVAEDQMQTSSEEEINALQDQSNSNDLSSIEADLNATNLDGLGDEMSNVEAEAQGSGSAQTQ